MSEQAFLDINIATESQIFNSMDGALFRRREIDPAMVDCIVGFAEKAPADAKLGLSVPIATMPQGIDVETIVSDPVCEEFRRRAADTRRKLARLFHDGRISLVIGANFVGLSIAIADWLQGYLSTSHYARLVVDTFVIDAWEALWHPVNIFLFEWWPIHRQGRLYDRLSLMTVRVQLE